LSLSKDKSGSGTNFRLTGYRLLLKISSVPFSFSEVFTRDRHRAIFFLPCPGQTEQGQKKKICPAL
jgi:hypothetical protein